MPRISKQGLLTRLLEALVESGITPHVLSRNHPFRILVPTADGPTVFRVYIWNLTHGGGAARPMDEYRIQITGIQKIDAEPGGVTVILGWWEDLQVFAAFDFQKHHRRLGKSPSIQIRLETLQRANTDGLSFGDKGNQELAFGVRPDMLAVYLAAAEALHKFGINKSDLKALKNLTGQTLGAVAQDLQEVSGKRKRVLKQVARIARDTNFRLRVLNAYAQRCAFCGVQLRLLDAAHIIPVSAPGSTDETCNGLALCALHHRAYDSGLVLALEDYSLSISEKAIDSLKRRDLARGLERFRTNLRPALALPIDSRDYPSASYLRQGRTLRAGTVL